MQIPLPTTSSHLTTKPISRHGDLKLEKNSGWRSPDFFQSSFFCSSPTRIPDLFRRLPHLHLTKGSSFVLGSCVCFWSGAFWLEDKNTHLRQLEIGMGDLEVEKHVQYILSVEKKKDCFESLVMEHLRLNGAYWGLTTLDLLHKLDVVDHDEVVSWIMGCWHDCGGFGGNLGHDPHILYTVSAVQVLALLDKLDVLDVDKVSNYISSLQKEDGSFSGDIWGEIDTRFSYCAILCLSILNRLDKINVEKAVNYIVSCKNLDGGFGCTPGAESHAGQIFCCVGALALTGSLNYVDKDLLGWWLCERQVKCGGLNGRPEKLPDVCYSWWVLSSLIMIDRVHWIDKKRLANFILDCQDKDKGGISDRPDDAVDVFHTYFGVAGLSLLEYPGLKAIDPAYALPVDVVNRLFFGN